MSTATGGTFPVLTPWEAKARRVIAELCFDAWDKANPRRNGRRPKKHRPYHVPGVADLLVTALGEHDDAERERKVKSTLLHHNYLIFTGGHD